MKETATETTIEGTHRVHLDTSRCRAYGICVGVAPDVFDLPKGSPAAVLSRDVIGEADLDDVEEAVEVCPAMALKLVKIEEEA